MSLNYWTDGGPATPLRRDDNSSSSHRALALALALALTLDLFRVTAARMRVFNASSSILSPSWKSMARLVFPSRLELKRLEGSFRAAPLANVIVTTFL